MRARHPGRLRTVSNIILSMTAVFSALGLMAVLAFFLLAWLYQRTGPPPALLGQVINTLLAFFFLGLILFTMGRFFTRRQMEWFNPIINAMDRIAKGDFSIRLAEGEDNEGALGELVRSVNKMAGELNEMEQMRQEFVSNVSHEIQSPLTNIRGFARALQEDDLPPETRQHYLSIIQTESMRLSKLSDNLLELASLDSEQLKLDPKPYRLDKQIRMLILACEPQWAEKSLELDAALDEATVITADEDLLSQVWINLIHNSIKFTPAGGSVRVAVTQQAGCVQVTVTDSGPGIAPADQAHIFERFYKADKARRRSEGGNGLGLSIVKKIVDLHHGTVAVESQSGQGAAFTVSLPQSG